MPEYNKPPIGITPRKIWLERRLADLHGAIYRRYGTDYPALDAWYEEIELIEKEIYPPLPEPLSRLDRILWQIKAVFRRKTRDEGKPAGEAYEAMARAIADAGKALESKGARN